MINQCLLALANNASPSLGAFSPVDFPAVCFEWATLSFLENQNELDHRPRLHHPMNPIEKEVYGLDSV